VVRRLQDEVFVAQAELARDPASPRDGPTLGPKHVERLEHDIDVFDARHPPLRGFVVPGGAPPAAMLQVARTVARRAERELVGLNAGEPVDPSLLAWANRLSDLLFALALATNHALGLAESAPRYDT
jgi:cob(I)alamin adenosyltransferase